MTAPAFVAVLTASQYNQQQAFHLEYVNTTPPPSEHLTCACLRCQGALQGACGHIPLPQQAILASGEHVLVQWVNHQVKEHAVRQRFNVVSSTAAVAAKHPGFDMQAGAAVAQESRTRSYHMHLYECTASFANGSKPDSELLCNPIACWRKLT